MGNWVHDYPYLWSTLSKYEVSDCERVSAKSILLPGTQCHGQNSPKIKHSLTSRS